MILIKRIDIQQSTRLVATIHASMLSGIGVRYYIDDTGVGVVRSPGPSKMSILPARYIDAMIVVQHAPVVLLMIRSKAAFFTRTKWGSLWKNLFSSQFEYEPENMELGVFIESTETCSAEALIQLVSTCGYQTKSYLWSDYCSSL